MRLLPLAVAALLATGCSGSPEAAPAPSATTPEPSATTTLSPDDATALLWRGVRADDPAVVQAAIDQGADLEARRSRERTPLVWATKRRHVEAARVLLEAGADPDTKDDLDDSAFLYAGAEGIVDVLELTIEHGADPRSTNRFGGTALIPASEHAHVEAVRLLIDAGVPVNHVNDLGWTALHEAIVLGNGSDRHVEVVRMLLAAGADVTIPDRNGVLPRRLAEQRGYTAIVAAIDASVA